MQEAQRLYIEQSDLARRLQLSAREDTEGETDMPLVIWDVGLGAGANAMAAILCYEAQAAAGPVRPMHLVSFENDLDPLHLAFQHNREFTYLRHAAVAGILDAGQWQSPHHSGLRWTLAHGDFLASISRAPGPPDLIFYDMFSSKTDADHWRLSAFQQVFAACERQATELFTYTCSTPIRAALLAAGFYVAQGRSTGEKVETTVALTPAAVRSSSSWHARLLGAEWLARWARSSAKFPADLPVEQQPPFEHIVRSHPQFMSLSQQAPAQERAGCR
jgi:queuine tRNA-ribosyltransferase